MNRTPDVSRPTAAGAARRASRAGDKAKRRPRQAGTPKRACRKWPVPTGAVWWCSLPHHPVIGALGREVYHQRHELRGWSLVDLHEATGIAASHLWDVERGNHKLSVEMELRLEAAFGMVRHGLMTLAWRRLEREQQAAAEGIR